MTPTSTLTFGMVLADDTLAVLLGDGFAETSFPQSAPREISRPKRALLARGSGIEKVFVAVVGVALAGVLMPIWTAIQGVLML